MNPRVFAEVPVITVKAGETLTVWLRVKDHPLHQEQVELRVQPDGTPEIFTNQDQDSSPNLLDFDKWTIMVPPKGGRR